MRQAANSVWRLRSTTVKCVGIRDRPPPLHFPHNRPRPGRGRRRRRPPPGRPRDGAPSMPRLYSRPQTSAAATASYINTPGRATQQEEPQARIVRKDILPTCGHLAVDAIRTTPRAGTRTAFEPAGEPFAKTRCSVAFACMASDIRQQVRRSWRARICRWSRRPGRDHGESSVAPARYNVKMLLPAVMAGVRRNPRRQCS